MSYTPSASLATLRRRAALLASIREFFAARGVLEVETPALSTAGISDVAIESIAATARSFAPQALYLHTSPEFAMKRLLAAGSGDIYQLCRVFRDDELGRWHQPEFTLLEWYRVGWDEQRLMQEVEALIGVALTSVAARETLSGTSRRLTYDEALRQALGIGLDAEHDEIVQRLDRAGIDVPAGLTTDALLDLAFGTVVPASFDPQAITFVYDYPASQAALARLKKDRPSVAARFEVFAGGIELANGFHELTDPLEQRRRFENDLARRHRSGQVLPPIDEDFLTALATLPDCAGVALGVDRLVAFATGQTELAAAVSFAHVRPE